MKHKTLKNEKTRKTIRGKTSKNSKTKTDMIVEGATGSNFNLKKKL